QRALAKIAVDVLEPAPRKVPRPTSAQTVQRSPDLEVGEKTVVATGVAANKDPRRRVEGVARGLDARIGITEADRKATRIEPEIDTGGLVAPRHVRLGNLERERVDARLIEEEVAIESKGPVVFGHDQNHHAIGSRAPADHEARHRENEHAAQVAL